MAKIRTILQKCNDYKIYHILIAIECIVFLYIFINNITADVIWRSFIPAVISSLVGIGVTLWYSEINKEGCFNFKEHFKGKFIPSFIVGLTLSLFTLLASLTSENIEIKIPADIVCDYNTGKSLEKLDEKYEHYFGCKYFLLRRYVEYTPYVNADKNKFQRIMFPEDVVFLETLTLLFSACQQDQGTGAVVPTINPDYDASGLGGIYLINPLVNSPFTQLPKHSLRKCKFPEKIKRQLSESQQEIYLQNKQTDLFKLLGLDDIYIPKGTKIELNSKERHIHFENTFVDVNVTVYGYGTHIGLNRDWQAILGYSDNKNKEYFTSKVAIIINARLKKLRSGHPDMPKYEKWINAIIDRISECVDSEKHLRDAKEKYFLHKTEIDSFQTILANKTINKKTVTKDRKIKPDPNDPLIGSNMIKVAGEDKINIYYMKIATCILIIIFATSLFVLYLKKQNRKE